MSRTYGFAAWLLSSLGLALIVCSVLLVPSGAALGSELTLPPTLAVCPGNSCNKTCISFDCFDQRGCTGTLCSCNNGGLNCNLCECKLGGSECYCGNR